MFTNYITMKSFLRSINDAARFEKAKKNIVAQNKKVKNEKLKKIYIRK